MVGASCEIAYSATKGGINALTKALAKELAPTNIQVNAVACGAIDTEMNQWMEEDELIRLVDDIPAGRLGSAEEVADLVYHLGYKDAYLTGGHRSGRGVDLIRPTPAEAKAALPSREPYSGPRAAGRLPRFQLCVRICGSCLHRRTYSRSCGSPHNSCKNHWPGPETRSPALWCRIALPRGDSVLIILCMEFPRILVTSL